MRDPFIRFSDPSFDSPCKAILEEFLFSDLYSFLDLSLQDVGLALAGKVIGDVLGSGAICWDDVLQRCPG